MWLGLPKFPGPQSLPTLVAAGTSFPEHRPVKSTAIPGQLVAAAGKSVKWRIPLTRTGMWLGRSPSLSHSAMQRFSQPGAVPSTQYPLLQYL